MLGDPSPPSVKVSALRVLVSLAMSRLIAVVVALVFVNADASAKSIDNVNWLDRAAWNCAKTIAVRPFSISGEFKGPKSQEEYMKLFVARLSNALVRPGGIEKVSLVTPDEPVMSDAVIAGEFLELSAGSRAARFWVGFGAGTAKTEVRIRAYRPDERTQILDLQHARIAPLSLSGDANIGNIDAVVADLGEELIKRRAACNPDEIRPVVAAAPVSNEKDSGEVTIESNVPNADVFVDGKFVGNAPLAAYRLSPGAHVIEVSSKGFVTWNRELTVTAGSPTRVVAQLEAAQ